MATKSATLEELQALQDELSAGQRGREPEAAAPPAKVDPPAEAAPGEPGALQDEAAMGGQADEDIGALMREAAAYLEERRGDLAANPLAIAIGSFVLGLIVGRILPQRRGD